jgi:ATP-binding cassette subfamily A (ABC1) protein 3
MEEAEALATNVAIMGTKMLATGTLGSLQETYGGAFGVRVVRAQDTSPENVEHMIKERFENAVSNYQDSHGQVSFNLPHDKRALGGIMRIMEGLKGNTIEDMDQAEANGAGSSSAAAVGGARVLQDYTITGPTLEEVFMNVARENGITGGV